MEKNNNEELDLHACGMCDFMSLSSVRNVCFFFVGEDEFWSRKEKTEKRNFF